jgi:hypothetical protein
MSATRRLQEARKTRRRIGSTFSLMHTGALTLEHILTNPPVHLKHVRIFTLMLHTPKLGEDGVRKCLREAKVEGIEFVGKLDQEARLRIISHLPPRAR